VVRRDWRSLFMNRRDWTISAVVVCRERTIVVGISRGTMIFAVTCCGRRRQAPFKLREHRHQVSFLGTGAHAVFLLCDAMRLSKLHTLYALKRGRYYSSLWKLFNKKS
jgi:hypothetical protein